MAIFGWLVLLCITLYLAKQSSNVFRGCLLFTGRLGGEFYFFIVVTLILAGITVYTFPFEVAMKAAS